MTSVLFDEVETVGKTNLRAKKHREKPWWIWYKWTDPELYKKYGKEDKFNAWTKHIFSFDWWEEGLYEQNQVLSTANETMATFLTGGREWKMVNHFNGDTVDLDIINKTLSLKAKDLC